jgi:hypothetical protein
LFANDVIEELREITIIVTSGEKEVRKVKRRKEREKREKQLT